MPDVCRILIVEDNYDQAAFLGDFLQLEGNYRVDRAQDIKSLWERLAADSYDLILLDYRLPDGNGLEALDQIAAKGYKLPVIMVTGVGDERIAVQAIHRGAADYVVKRQDYYLTLPGLIEKVIKDYDLQRSVETSLEKIRYQALILNNVQDAVVVWDVEGKITFWNAAAEALFDWREDFSGRQVTEHYFPLFSPLPVWNTLAQQSEVEVERQVVKPDGLVSWISSRITTLCDQAAGGRVIGYMDVLRDITERKKAQEELTRLYRAVQQIVDSVIIANRDGIIEYINPAFERLSGIKKDTAIGRNLNTVFMTHHNQHLINKLWETILRDQVFRTEFIAENQQGEKYYLEEIVTPIRDTYGSITHLVLTIRDMTEHRRMEAQVRSALAQLTQATRLAAIGELAAGVAHRIYNPLTTIIAETQILSRSLPADHPAKESAVDIEKAGWKAQEVVKHLLDFSRPDTGTLKMLSINRTIQTALMLVGAHIQAVDVNLEVQFGENLPEIYGNERQVEDLWVNLLTQARDATSDGKPHLIQIRSSHGPDGAVIVEVKDDGRSIPPDQLVKIFEPNFIGSTIGRGSGLEFSICREIVRQHKGEIHAQSYGGSTTFQVVFSRVREGRISRKDLD